MSLHRGPFGPIGALLSHNAILKWIQHFTKENQLHSVSYVNNNEIKLKIHDLLPTTCRLPMN